MLRRVQWFNAPAVTTATASSFASSSTATVLHPDLSISSTPSHSNQAARLSLTQKSLRLRPYVSTALQAAAPEDSIHNKDSHMTIQSIDDAETVMSDPYGNEYGAGPSRIPYPSHPSHSDPLRSSSTNTANKAEPILIGDTTTSALPHSSPRLTKRQLIKQRKKQQRAAFKIHFLTLAPSQRRQLLRKSLNSLPPSSLGSLENFSRALHLDIRDLSRSEVHVVLHWLIKVKKGDLATSILCEAVESGAVFRPDGGMIQDTFKTEGSGLAAVPLTLKRKRYFASKTLFSLFNADILPVNDRHRIPSSPARMKMLNSNPAHGFRSFRQSQLTTSQIQSRPKPNPTSTNSNYTPPPLPLPSLNPVISDQTPTPPSRRTLGVLSVIDQLSRIRHPRVDALYIHAIKLCIGDNRPDEAAKVYVGLVEEWILEGRVAEGADPEDFYPGGGPPRVSVSPSEQIAAPENVLEGKEIAVSPVTNIVDRRKRSLLSLWFSGVRTWKLPGEILSPHDRLDLWHPRHLAVGEKMRGFPFPLPTSPPTLVPMPTTSLLLPILEALHLDPSQSSPVDFAASMRALAILANPILSRTLPIPAIPTLLKAFSLSPLAPDVYPESFTSVPTRHSWAYTANTQVHVALMSLLWSPPNFAHAVELEQRYASHEHMRRPKGAAQYRLPPLPWNACRVLVHYGLEQLKRPELLGRLYGYMREKWHTWSSNVVNSMFRGTTKLGRSYKSLSEGFDDALFAGTSLGRDNELKDSKETNTTKVNTSTSEHLAIPNEESLVLLIRYLAATSQFPRLVKVVHTMIPFLSFNKAMSDEEVDRLLLKFGIDRDIPKSEEGQKKQRPQRPAPGPLPPKVYATIIKALRKGGHTGLAQRVFNLALEAESTWVAESSLRLPIDIFTDMIQLFDKEANAARDKPESKILGWRPPPRMIGVTRLEGADGMIAHLYNLARARWEREGLGSSSKQTMGQLSCDQELKEERVGLKSRSPIVPTTSFFNAIIRARTVRWNLHTSASLSESSRIEMTHVIQDIEAFGFAVPNGLIEKLELGSVKPGSDLVVRKRGFGDRSIDISAGRAEKDMNGTEGARTGNKGELKMPWTRTEVYDPFIDVMRDGWMTERIGIASSRNEEEIVVKE